MKNKRMMTKDESIPNTRQDVPMDFDAFHQEIDRLIDQDDMSQAIRRTIDRYGIKQVDERFRTLHIQRNGKDYRYYGKYNPSEMRANPVPKFALRDVIARCEYN